MTYIAMNRFKVGKDDTAAFELMWQQRESYLNRMPGFVTFHLLRGPEVDDHVLYASHTTWETRAHFEAWTVSEEFRRAMPAPEPAVRVSISATRSSKASSGPDDRRPPEGRGMTHAATEDAAARIDAALAQKPDGILEAVAAACEASLLDVLNRLPREAAIPVDGAAFEGSGRVSSSGATCCSSSTRRTWCWNAPPPSRERRRTDISTSTATARSAAISRQRTAGRSFSSTGMDAGRARSSSSTRRATRC